MMANEIKQRINEICSHFTFDYNGKSCGVDPFSHSEFDMWCGDDNKTVNSIEEVMTVPLFDGKSLSEIADEIQITEL